MEIMFPGKTLTPDPLSDVFNPPKIVKRQKYPPMFFHVSHVPPLEHRIRALVQYFDFPACKESLQPLEMEKHAELLQAMEVRHSDPLKLTMTMVLPAPVAGLPANFKVPPMLFYGTGNFVVSLYKQQGSSGQYHCMWTEVAAYRLPPQHFPAVPMPEKWKLDSDNHELFQAQVRLSEVCAEQWTMEKISRDFVIQNTNKSTSMILSIRKTTLVDPKTKSDTGQPLTIYQNRVYGLYAFALVLDEAHIAPLVSQ